MKYVVYLLVLIVIIGGLSVIFLTDQNFTLTGAAIGLQTIPNTPKDAELRSGTNKKNYGTSEEIDIDKNDRNSIFEFNLSSLPANSTLSSAAMRLFITDATQDDKTAAIDVYRLTREWAEGTGDGQKTNDGATWKYYNNNDNWDNSGGDYDVFIWATTGVTNESNWYSWDITHLVKSWYNGTYTNYGLLILTESNNVGRKTFASSENTNASIRPQLVLNYSTPPIISNVNSTLVEHTTANIIWNTDDASNSTVNYGLTTSLGTLTTNSTSVTSHNIGLANLQDNLTTYYYQVMSCNSASLCVESSVYSFTTLQNITEPEPNIDITAPDVTITSPENITFETPLININYIVSDDVQLDSCWYALDNEENVTSESCSNWGNVTMSESQHELHIYAADNSSNIGSDSILFIIDLPEEQQEQSGGNPPQSIGSSGGGGSSTSEDGGLVAASQLEIQSEQTDFVEKVSNEPQPAQNLDFLTGGFTVSNLSSPETIGISFALLLVSIAALLSYIHPEWLRCK